MTESSPSEPELSREVVAFYRRAMDALREAHVPFLVGGAYAFHAYTGIARRTKDIDFFVRAADADKAMHAFDRVGLHTEPEYAHWLAKASDGGAAIDLVFGSGNGVARVDDAWFERAVADEVLGVRVLLCSLEDMLWMKAYIMERERYDGADVAHLLHAGVDTLDWSYLLDRFGDHWRVLLSHVVLFGFIYPSERQRIPDTVMDEFLERLEEERTQPPPSDRVCQGTLLSREQYLVDVKKWGYEDARLHPRGTLTADEIGEWTDDIDDEDHPHEQGGREES